MTRIFEDAGVDAIKGSQIMDLLDLSLEELNIPQRFNRFVEIADFMKNYSNFPHVIRKICIGKDVDRLSHVWTYTQLAKNREQAKFDFAEIKKQYKEDKSLKDKYEEIEKTLNEVESEMELYEK